MDWKELGKQTYAQLNRAQKAWLDDNVELDASDLYAEMPTEELLRSFRQKPKAGEAETSPSAQTLDDVRVVRTLVWQKLLQIRVGSVPPIRGNLRSFWYLHGQPLYLRHGFLSTSQSAQALTLQEDDDLWVEDDLWAVLEPSQDNVAGPVFAAARGGHVAYITRCCVQCVGDFVRQRIARYSDFGFTEPARGAMRLIGSGHASVIFYTEKVGLFALCQQYHDVYGITGVASNGECSLLSMEYLAEQLRKKRIRKIHIGTLTDYDPWGWKIAQNFELKLRHFGFNVIHTRLTELKLFDPKVLETNADELSHYKGGKATQADEWFKKTNGIHGRRAGIHIDLADRAKVDGAVASWLRKLGVKKRSLA